MNLVEPQTQAAFNMRQYFLRNLFVFTHVEKTAGSSFVLGLRSILGDEHVYDIRGKFPRPYEMSPPELIRIWLFAGHFWFDTQERPFARRKHHFMSMRDPVDRFISSYNYVAASKSHPGYPKYGVLDIEGAFHYQCKHNPNGIFNRFCAMFGDRVPKTPIGMPGKPLRPRRPVTFEEAREKIDQHYALVIPMRRMDDAVRRIGAVLGVEVPEVEHANIGVKKTNTVPDSVRQQLREGNAEDYKLLAYCEAMFDQRLEELPARLMR